MLASLVRTWQGSMVALATPFRNGEIDREAYRALIRNQLEHGTSGLVPAGTTGESATLALAERLELVKIAVDEAAGRIPVIAGAGSNDTQETVRAVKEVQRLGADAALLVTPYYNRPTQEGLFEHYRAVARANPGFPLVPYNVPGRTGVDLLPETCARLCELPEVVAIKEATGSMARCMDLRRLCGERLSLLSGDDATIYPFVFCGGSGVISVSANVAPRLVADLVARAREGSWGRALELQLRLADLHRLLFAEPNPIPVKWALHLMGCFGPEIRLPLVPLGTERGRPLEAELRKLGILP